MTTAATASWKQTAAVYTFLAIPGYEAYSIQTYTLLKTGPAP
jgi:hypothetical protein